MKLLEGPHKRSLTAAVLSRWPNAWSRLLNHARKNVAWVFELAGELSDQNAYTRYLQTTGRSHSRDEWKAFSDRRNCRKYQNAKCC